MKTLLPLALLAANTEARAILREHIATKLKPNRIEIQCAEK